MKFKTNSPRINYFSTVVMIFLIIILLINSDFAYAQTQTITDDEVNAIAHELYCPVCENVPLDVCPTQACAQWRALIREKLEQGWTEDQIKQYFVDQYGDRVLAQPPARGLNLLVYIIPPLFFVGGIFLVYSNLKKLKKSPDQIIQQNKIENEDKYLQEIEKALKELDKSDN